MQCDIIIPIWNQLELTKNCLESIKRFTDSPYRLILIDNGSNPEINDYLVALKSDPSLNVILISNRENLGWVKAINQGLQVADAEFVCFQNNDIEVSRGWLKGLIDIALFDKTIGIVNPAWEKTPRTKKNPNYTELDYCRGFCMLVKKEVINKIGGLDEVFGMGYYDDWDFSLKAISAGYKCVRANNVNVIHHKEKSFSVMFDKEAWNKLFERNKSIFYKRWGKPLRFLLTLDLKTEMNRNELENMLRRLLKRQHKVFLIARGRMGFKINHSNFRVAVFPGVLFEIIAKADILNNLRKKIDKRYDVILTNSKTFFKKIDHPSLKNKFKAYEDDLNNGFSQKFVNFINENFEKPEAADVV